MTGLTSISTRTTDAQATDAQLSIEFPCPTCGRTFRVGAELAGRRARCKVCRGDFVVPAAGAPPAPARAVDVPAPLPPMRIRRLTADAEQLKVFERSQLIRVTPIDSSSPPESYRVDYHVAGLERGDGPDGAANPRPRTHHVVEIRLTSDYPRLAPQCTMRTPVFHPNISPEGTTICIGDHWTAGERLADLIVRIGEMLAYQAYNIRSPLDGEAAMWADLHADQLPTDTRDLHPAE